MADLPKPECQRCRTLREIDRASGQSIKLGDRNSDANKENARRRKEAREKLADHRSKYCLYSQPAPTWSVLARVMETAVVPVMDAKVEIKVSEELPVIQPPSDILEYKVGFVGVADLYRKQKIKAVIDARGDVIKVGDLFVLPSPDPKVPIWLAKVRSFTQTTVTYDWYDGKLWGPYAPDFIWSDLGDRIPNTETKELVNMSFIHWGFSLDERAKICKDDKDVIKRHEFWPTDKARKRLKRT